MVRRRRGRRGHGPDWRGQRRFGIASPGKPPDGMGMERWWNAWEPGQRTWVGRRELWEAPVKDGGHVACSAEVSSGGGCLQVAERVFSCFGRVGLWTGQRWSVRLHGAIGLGRVPRVTAYEPLLLWGGLMTPPSGAHSPRCRCDSGRPYGRAATRLSPCNKITLGPEPKRR